MSVVADSTGVPFCIREADNEPEARGPGDGVPGDGAPCAGGADVVDQVGTWAMASLHSTDVEAAQNFYARTFGWEIQPVMDAPFSQWFLKEQPIGLLVGAGDAPQHWSLNFAVADADAAARTAAAEGGAVLMGPFDTDRHRNAVIADPAGAVIACSAPRSGAC